MVNGKMLLVDGSIDLSQPKPKAEETSSGGGFRALSPIPNFEKILGEISSSKQGVVNFGNAVSAGSALAAQLMTAAHEKILAAL